MPVPVVEEKPTVGVSEAKTIFESKPLESRATFKYDTKIGESRELLPLLFSALAWFVLVPFSTLCSQEGSQRQYRSNGKFGF